MDTQRTLTHEENISLSQIVQQLRDEMCKNDCTGKFTDQLQQFQQLNLNEDQINILKKGLKAREKMFLGNQKLVYKFAHRLVHRSLPLDDLISIGNLGLMRAIENFDPEKGFRFSTFAWFWVRPAMAKACAKNDTLLSVAPEQIRKLHRINNAKQDWMCKYQKEPTNKELANYLDLPEKSIENTLKNHYSTVSLQIDDTGETGEETQEEALIGEVNPLDEMTCFEDTLEDRKYLNDLLNRLDEESKQIFINHYLNGLSKKEVGKKFGYSTHKISAIIREGLNLLNLIVSA